MSRGAIMSIMGLWNNDPSIFDLMQLPEGFTDDDRETVRDSILIECAELEVLYAAPAVMKNCIGIWSRKELPVWQRIYNASLLEYNPIENYRRNETETIEDDRTEEHSGSDINTAGGTDTNRATGVDTTRASGTDATSGSSTSTTTDGGTTVTKNDKTGFDSNAMVPSDQQTIEHGMTQGVSESASNSTNYGRVDTFEHGRTDTFQHGKTETLAHGEKIEHSGDSTRTNLAYGNIGVTTSQQMLTQEIEIAKIINVIPMIVDSFKNRFCLMVY